MKEKDIITRIKVAEYDELDDRRRALVDKARRSTYRSYAPYSRFSVGAAIELDNGETVCGANQENAAFSSGTCAERSAAFYAHAQFPDAAFRTIAIAARGTDGSEVAEPISPCGACRQALMEYEKLAGHDVEVILVGAGKIYILPSVHSTLPLTFSEF